MRMKFLRFSGRAKLIGIIILAVIMFYGIRSLFFESVKFMPVSAASLAYELSEPPNYLTAVRNYQEQQLRPTQGIRIDIPAASHTQISSDAQIQIVKDTELGEDVLYWNNEAGYVDWEVLIPEDGLYEIHADYRPLPGTYSSAIRGLMIDGGYPFAELEKVEFERYWKDEKYPYEVNEIGNEIRSQQVEIEGWKHTAITNYVTSSIPLQHHFTKGLHTLRMVGVREPMALLRWSIISPEAVPDYRDYVEGHPAVQQEKDWFHVTEAEQFNQKSSIGIQKYPVLDPYVQPDPKGRIVFNTLGADRWKFPGQWVEWTMEVPSDGWYALDLKYRQIYKGRSKVYRTLLIDGQVPFKEMLHYAFDYERSFKIQTLENTKGTPFLFYLKRGAHTLRIVADSEPMRPALLALHRTLQEMRLFDSTTRTIIGDYGKFSVGNVDLNRTWDMKKYIPDIDQQLSRFITELQDISFYINGLNGRETDLTSAIKIAVETMEDISQDVDKLPNRLTKFTEVQTQIGTWLADANDQPFLLDYFVVRTPETQTNLKVANQWEKTIYSTVNFLRTFYLKYTLSKTDDENTINVWVQRGRDYVDLLQELIDQDFTPQTGIKVNVNLMPNPNVLVLGNVVGNQPDVALGVAMETPVNFAMRGAIADLSAMPGFEEVKDQFSQGVLRSYAYNGKLYGLPEVQNFMAFFYRTDIFKQLNLSPPDTWEDLYRLLPSLQERGKTFYYPAKEFVPFFYQRGMDFYTADGMSSHLHDEKATEAFTEWTDLYQKYYVPLDVPAFFNHFRYGDIPAGIADFNTYVLLSVAAPDIAGQWKMVPIPGIKQEDGTIARWSQQTTTSMMIMNKSKKQDKAWTFLKWWSSTETQLRYAQDIESLFGLEYRWNSANLKALEQSPWPSEDWQTIKEQSRWIKNIPIVPGFYYLNREIEFAWNSVLLDGMPEKEALEKGALSLEREMKSKQEELGLDPATDNLSVPQVNLPYDWEGAADDK